MSGLYMDDYEHGIPYKFPKSAKECADGSVWDVMQKAKVEGINDAVTHLLLAIGKNRNKFVDGYAGDFGEINRKRTNSVDKTCKKGFNGFTFTPNVYKGASLKLKKVWLGLDLAGDYIVNIHDITDLTTPVASFTVSHPGAYSMTASTGDSVLIPLSQGSRPITYVVSYARGASFPLDITFYCGCGENYKPQWMKSKYFEASGFCVDDLASVIPNASCCNKKITGGLILEWEMVCDPGAWMCQQDKTFWNSTQWGRVAAKASQLIITSKSISAVIDSGKTNYYTMTSSEDLAAKRQKFTELAMELFDYLGSNMPDHVSHCWKCKADSDFRKNSIII